MTFRLMMMAINMSSNNNEQTIVNIDIRAYNLTVLFLLTLQYGCTKKENAC